MTDTQPNRCATIARNQPRTISWTTKTKCITSAPPATTLSPSASKLQLPHGRGQRHRTLRQVPHGHFPGPG